ncbi:MAG TPA: hypothetical protein VF885_00870 [Arthrobacter sp.]
MTTATFTLMLLLGSGPLLGAFMFGLCGLFMLVLFAHLVKAKLPKPGIAVHIADDTLFESSTKETQHEHSPSVDTHADAA